MSLEPVRRPALSLLAIALAAFVMLGLVDAAVGVAWPTLQATFDRSVSDLGLLLAMGSLGYLSTSVGFGWLHSRLGTGNLLGIGGGLIALALVGIAGAPTWIVVAASSVLLGVGGGLVDTGMNAHAALAFDIRSMNLLHACFGVGATLGPVVITVSLTTSGAWRAGYGFLAVLQLAIAVLVWSRRHRWAGEEPDLSPEAPVVSHRLRQTLLISSFVIYTGVEVAAGQWSFTVLTESRGMGTAAAGAWVAAYWGGLTAGRFLFGVLGDRMSPSLTLDSSVVVSVVGIGVFWLDPAGWGMVGLPVAGLGLAAVFPTLVSLTPMRLGRDRSTRAVGFQLAGATIGASSIPWLLGLIGAASDLEALVLGLFVASVVLGVVLVAGDRESRRQGVV